jgi:hypothetical protein
MPLFEQPGNALVVMLPAGAAGAIMLFIADLILYYPSKRKDRSAQSYFERIDPGGTNMAGSSMQGISISRVMFGGVLGPVASLAYSIGYFGILFGFGQNDHPSSLLLPMMVSISLSLCMTIASAYHAMFAYTCFLSKEIAKEKKEGSTTAPLLRLVETHRTYLKYIYKWAAVPALVGSAAYAYACLFSSSVFSPWTIIFVPVMSAPLKKILKRKNIGSLVLCGGFTNLWNLCFFMSLIVSSRMN